MPPALAVPVAMALLALFRVVDRPHGLARALLLLAVAGFMLWARRPDDRPRPRLTLAAHALAALALVADLAVAATGIVHAARTGDIYLDQGENTRAAALLLARGADPYGDRALIDVESYRKLEPGGDPARAAEYRRTLDDRLRDELLPAGAAPEHRYGHKYGPLNVLIALPFVLGLGATGIPVLNLGYFLAFVALVARIARRRGVAPLGRALVVLAVAADVVAVAAFLRNSAQDIGCMALCAAAVAAYLEDQAMLAGVALGAALAMKVFPAAIFLPLLLPLGVRAAAACAAVALALHLPFLVWDARGLWDNLFGWSLVRHGDATAWLFFAPPALAAAGRAVLAALALALVVVMARRGPSFVGLALLTVTALLAGATMHNNYVPWLSWLVYLALVDPSSSTEAAMASGGSGGGASPSRRRAWGSSIMSTLT